METTPAAPQAAQVSMPLATDPSWMSHNCHAMTFMSNMQIRQGMFAAESVANRCRAHDCWVTCHM